MKKLYTLPLALVMALSASAQITISSTDMPAPTGLYHVRLGMFAQANPASGANMTWTYDSASSAGGYYSTYQETETYFTAAGIDAYRAKSKTFAGFTYTYYQELDFNSTSVALGGHYIGAYPKQALPGSTTDSMSSNADSGVLANKMPIIQFPFTYNNSWHNVSDRIAYTFYFTVPSMALVNTPVQHVFHVNENDTIVGWGKMRIYNSATTSVYYDVLMDKRFSYNTDSFLSAGLPLPSTTLTYFNSSQGMHTDSSYEVYFFRKTTYCPLMYISYGKDPSYSSQKSIFYDSSITTSGVNGINKPSYTTVLYPNPATGNEVNMLISGISGIKTVEYHIADMTGRIVQSGKVELAGNNVKINLDASVVTGNYILYAADKQNGFEAKEEFTVSK